MSCDFNIYCLDCGEDTDFHDVNWGGDYFLAAMKYRTQLEVEGLFNDPDMWWFTDDCGRLGTLVRFFSRHEGTSGGTCILEKGHAGEHHIPPRLEWNETTRKYAEKK